MTVKEMMNNLKIFDMGCGLDFEDYEIDFFFEIAQKYGVDKLALSHYILSKKEKCIMKNKKSFIFEDRKSVV